MEGQPGETKTLWFSTKPRIDVNKTLTIEGLYCKTANECVDAYVFREGKVDKDSRDKMFKNQPAPRPKEGSLGKFSLLIKLQYPGTYNYTVHVNNTTCTTIFNVHQLFTTARPNHTEPNQTEPNQTDADGNSDQDKQGSDPGTIGGSIVSSIVVIIIVIVIIYKYCIKKRTNERRGNQDTGEERRGNQDTGEERRGNQDTGEEMTQLRVGDPNAPAEENIKNQRNMILLQRRNCKMF
ncbi:uncharacterized protein [Cebidichthys violaceus]